METKKTVVVIDDNPSNLQAIITNLRETYTIIPFTSAREALKFFGKGNACNLILLDIEMPGMNGFETIRALKAMPNVRGIPVIFLTGRNETASEMEGLSLGAVDYIYKPFNPVLVEKRISIHIALENYSSGLERLVRLKTHTIEKLTDVTISTIISLFGSKDQETQGHIQRTSAYVVSLALELRASGVRAAELSDEAVDMLRRSAPLHDVGKAGISDAILKKPARLSPEEFEEMKLHTVIGGEALAEARRSMNEPSFLDTAEILAMYHHERWDGAGYPKGLAGENIPFLARIMSVADVYDALISARPYKPAFTHEKAVAIIAESIGTQFDPDVGTAFLRIHTAFHSIAKQFVDHE